MINEFFTKRQNGTSLIELILYLGLLSIVLIIATDIMFRTSEFSLESAAKDYPQDEARYVINRLKYDIRRADNIVLPTNLGDSLNRIRLTINGNDYVYRQRNQTMAIQRRQVGVAGWISLTSNFVSAPIAMNFTRLGNTGGKPTIKITFTLQSAKTPKGGPQPKTFETVVSTR